MEGGCGGVPTPGTNPTPCAHQNYMCGSRPRPHGRHSLPRLRVLTDLVCPSGAKPIKSASNPRQIRAESATSPPPGTTVLTLAATTHNTRCTTLGRYISTFSSIADPDHAIPPFLLLSSPLVLTMPSIWAWALHRLTHKRRWHASRKVFAHALQLLHPDPRPFASLTIFRLHVPLFSHQLTKWSRSTL